MAIVDSQLPLISVIVPSFNQGRYLRETLESIFRQDYPRLEVVVMDGGSTDESVEIIQSYADRLAYWQSQPDGGQSAAINAGVRRCNGQIVAWLNSDDFYWGDSLWTVARAYAAFPDHGLYIGNGLRYSQQGQRYEPFCRRHIALNRAALIHGLDYILQPATFFLRSAWDEAQELNPELRYCMDWDLIIRIAARYPAVLINEFLAVSREHEETKTSGGKMGRAFEISRLTQSHSRQEATTGSVFYLLETLLDVTDDATSPQLRYHLYAGMNAIKAQWAAQYGNGDGFPEHGDPQDRVYLPIATADAPRRPALRLGSGQAPDDRSALPRISIITPSFNQAQFLGQTLDSIFNQGYPDLETLVFDGGSKDGSVDVLRQYQDRLTAWVSEPDRGPAHAINKGFATATGEILGWLNSDDLLASDALWEIARAFAEDPELDMVFANALYIDKHNQLFLADHGTHRTGLYYGEMQPLGRIPAYWSYVHAVPQPTVFFRRRLLERCGRLNEDYLFIFDFELFWRFAQKAKIKKLERTQAFYRIHAAAKTSDWNKFLVELYRFSRPWWPPLRSPQFKHTFRDFVASYMRRKYGGRPRDAWFWGAAALVGLSALTRVGNPEALDLRLPRARVPQPPAAPAPAPVPEQEPEPSPKSYQISHRDLRYRSLFCSYLWPRHPGHSGGEIRDFHLLRRLLAISSVEFFVPYASPPDRREDPLAHYLEALHTPESVGAARPDLVYLSALKRTGKNRAASLLQRNNLPVFGPRYHSDAAEKLPALLAFARAPLQEALEQRRPDFLFVSPQNNPIAVVLNTAGLPTRLIMASYDVEALRIRRLAASHQGLRRTAMDLEARRAVRFECENLACYDGIIAVSELDKQLFVADYGVDAQRVLVIENGVDVEYFAFAERYAGERPQIVFVGTLSYLPNRQAAWRLHQRIMPLVRRRYPDACLWIVGQGADQALLAHSDGRQTVVSGQVDDVRPYLANASVACVPLIAGSGTKYKVLEALSAGVPMVCSPMAAEGLDIADGEHVLVGESDEQLAAAIVRLLDAPALAGSLARCGRALVERRYAWDVNLARLDAWLELLAAMPRRGDTAPATTPGGRTNGTGPASHIGGHDPYLELPETNLEGSKQDV